MKNFILSRSLTLLTTVGSFLGLQSCMPTENQSHVISRAFESLTNPPPDAAKLNEERKSLLQHPDNDQPVGKGILENGGKSFDGDEAVAEKYLESKYGKKYKVLYLQGFKALEHDSEGNVEEVEYVSYANFGNEIKQDQNFAILTTDNKLIDVSKSSLVAMQRTLDYMTELHRLEQLYPVIGSSQDWNAGAHGNTTAVSFNIGMFLPKNGQTSTVRDLIHVAAHEGGHHVQYQHEGVIKTAMTPSLIREGVYADSLGMCAIGDFVGAARQNWKAILRNGSDYKPSPEEADHIHPSHINRVHMAVRLFAKDTMLSDSERGEQFKKLEVLNAELTPYKLDMPDGTTQTVNPPDLLKYYHDEFAKAHPELGKQQDKRTGSIDIDKAVKDALNSGINKEFIQHSGSNELAATLRSTAHLQQNQQNPASIAAMSNKARRQGGIT